MELRQLETFRMVAKTLNFTQTAAALGYVQSSVTAQIQALEGDLGVALFDRIGKRVMLTDAGERLLKYANEILSLADEARSVVGGKDAPIGTITIGAPETLLTYRLPAVLQQFQASFPHIRLTFHPSHWTDLYRHTNDGILDVAFMLAEPMPSNSLTIEALIREPLYVLAPPHHPLTQISGVCPKDLEREQLLLTELGCAYRNLFEHVLISGGVYPAATLEFNSIEAIKQCVMAGMGITVLPAIAVEKEVSQGRLIPLEWGGQPLEIATLMIWHKDKWLSPALQAFLEITRKTLELAGIYQVT